MKIGIVTITGSSNYGNKLQNYAMLELFKKLGYSSENVKKGVDVFPSLKFRLMRKGIILLKIKNYIKSHRQERFDAFIKKHFRFSQYMFDQPQFDANDYHKVVCGSDQIWNPLYEGENKEFYFARFAPDKKRVAFSASIGIDDIPQADKQWFAEYINGFEHISVREQQGAQIIKDLTGKDVAVTLDPTLMLSADEWSSIAKKPKYIKDDNFIVAYFLGEKADDVDAFVSKVAKEHNCKVICLQSNYTDNDKIADEKWFVSDPSEFVWLFANAKGVFTDSFHGCVFSTIFKTPFRWFSRSTDCLNKNMNSRMDTLFSKLGIGDWCIGKTNESADGVFNCDFSSVDENLAKEQQFAYDYLKGALSN